MITAIINVNFVNDTLIKDTITKKEIIDLLNSEMWYPKMPTDVQWETSKLLNAILADIMYKISKYESPDIKK